MALAGDHVQVLVGGYELTGDSNRVSISDSYDTHDVTTFGSAVHKFLLGQRKASVEHTGFMEVAAGRSHPVLRGADVQGVFSLYMGQNAAPVSSDPVYVLDSVQGKYSAKAETSQVIPFAATFNVRDGSGGGWGVALTPPVTMTNSTTGGAVDGGATTNAGGLTFLHILQAAASDRYTITVESADDAGFTVNLNTLATFSLNAAAIGSERIAVTLPIRRYTRYKAQRTTGSAGNQIKIAVSLVRF